MPHISPPVRATLLTALLTWVGHTSATAQNCAPNTPGLLGTATVINTTCGTGPYPQTTCYRLLVSCPDIPSLEVRVRVIEPDPALTIRGTIVFGTGGGGTDFYGERPGGTEIFQPLLNLGYRLVDRAWVGSWFDNGIGIRRQSCRYATMLTWVHQNVHTTGAFCATGNSGGSAEIGYALTSWGRDAILDVAVPSGGPPMSRLDYLCGITGQQWTQLCRTMVPPGVSQCGLAGCTIGGTGPICTSCSTTPTAQSLHEESILFPAATLHYPNTRVHVVIGAMDCSSAAPNGLLFAQAVTSSKALDFPAGTPHWVPQTTAGQEAILRALLGGAACTSVPATIAWPAWPHVGNAVLLELHGPVSQVFFVGLGFAETRLEIAPFGWLFVDQPAGIGFGSLDPVTGRATLPFLIPNNPALAGLQAFHQALAGSCLTNLVRIKVLP